MGLSLPFQEGQLIVAVLRDPRAKLWGRLLGLEPAGLALRAVDLHGWEELLALVKAGEGAQVSVSTRFLPMHRVEAMYLDEPDAGMPALGEAFLQRTGVAPHLFLKDPE